MKRFILSMLVVAVLPMALPLSARVHDCLTVATYNLRNANHGDSVRGNGWGGRMPYVADMMLYEQPDIFGTQECLSYQLEDLVARMPNYAYIGHGRDDGKSKGEHSAIFYNTKRLRLLRTGDFWLAEDPSVPKLGWDAACVRICSWGEFRDLQTRKRVYFFNLHMDHVGVVARREGARLVVRKIREIAGNNAAILTGDFNVDQTNEIYEIFTKDGQLRDSYEASAKRFATNGTFNSFKPTLYTRSRIDHIFLTHHYDVEAYAVLTNSYWTPDESQQATLKGEAAPQEIDFKHYVQRTISDHYPVFARLRLK